LKFVDKYRIGDFVDKPAAHRTRNGPTGGLRKSSTRL